MMKKTILIVLGVFGMLLSTPMDDAQAGVGVNIRLGGRRHHHYNRAPDPGETGVGHTTAQAKAFQSPEAAVIMAYHHAILQKIEKYVNNKLTEEELGRESYSPTLKFTRTVSSRITGVVQQGFLHVGQAGYVRGWIKGKGWYH